MNCNQTTNVPLTEEQKELVAKNHDLIYAYAHKMNISIGDYYDVLAIGLCKAAKHFTNSKSKFSTFAFACMQNELCNHWANAKRQSAVPESSLMSYDSADTSEDIVNRDKLIEAFSDCQPYEDMRYATMVSDILKVLNDKEKVVFNGLINGISRRDMADKMKCTVQNVGLYVQSIGEKVLEYLAYN